MSELSDCFKCVIPDIPVNHYGSLKKHFPCKKNTPHTIKKMSELTELTLYPIVSDDYDIFIGGCYG